MKKMTVKFKSRCCNAEARTDGHGYFNCTKCHKLCTVIDYAADKAEEEFLRL